MLDVIRYQLRWRIAKGLVFAVLGGTGNAAFLQMDTLAPLAAASVGLICGIILGSWWPLLVAPMGFLLGRLVVLMLDAETAPLEPLEWLLVLLGTLIGAAIGVLVYRWSLRRGIQGSH